ncbi:hypothetical protein TIFTF001_010698 [Ficus carica]|uniref:Uncharacterized protein n=1 Tax=Ficus carica TaxID=3494 RepID=A0AA87ZQJ1_FICCA|nr:hypothetical protein TIFTF001_010698 [Ficus carica]
MAETGGDHITTEFDSPANELENLMNSTSLTVSTQRCIFKVPNILSRHNPKANAPNAFSIGPYHYGKQHLQSTHNIKLKYLRDLISRFPSINPKAMDEFVKILLLDGCFLIELFRKTTDEDLRKDDDPMVTMSCMSQFLSHDLILLENQIPWWVLEILFNITGMPEDRTSPHLIILGLYGVLEIPQLLIQETTESLFRIVICLEQCLPNCAHIVITSYAILLEKLISTTEDMDILSKSGIVDNWLNIDDARELFNQLYDDTFVQEFYYSDLIAKVNEHCRCTWPRYRTVLMFDYFNRPWALVSVIAAIILLILTFLQILFTIIK